MYIMRKITNPNKNENKKKLLEAFSFSNLKEAKKYLDMKNSKANVVYDELMYLYNKQIDNINKEKLKDKNQINYYKKKDKTLAITQIKQFNRDGKSFTLTNVTRSKLEG